MRTPVKHFGLIFLVLFAALIWVAGCATHPDPLAGWRISDIKNLDTNKAISDDYQSYINTLSPKEKKYIGSVFYFEDGNGEHAIRISILLDNTEWEHILIYDKENKRMRVIKYVAGHYMS